MCASVRVHPSSCAGPAQTLTTRRGESGLIQMDTEECVCSAFAEARGQPRA
jgi:hypothetical protein